MTDLHSIPHTTNWARVTITRLGDGRNTRIRVLPQSEQQQENEEATGERIPIVNKYTRGKYGNSVKT